MEEININITKTERDILKAGLNLLVDFQNDSINYTDLFNKLDSLDN